MSGRGDQPPRDRNPFGGLKEEVLSALKLLFRNVEQHSVAVSLRTDITAYLTDIPAAACNVPLEAPVVRTSDDPIRMLQRSIAVSTLTLLPKGKLAESMPCNFEPVASHEPVFGDMDFAVTTVSFENMTLRQCKYWPVGGFEVKTDRKDIEPCDQPTIGQLPAEKIKTEAFSILDRLPKIRSLNNPRFYGLPIKKSPIPPHRFPTELRERFRQALAEKAKTRPANIQLRIVFERMDMTLYSAIQQDDLGNLLCTPRNELLGKNRTLGKSGSGTESSTYLVYGFRLDNKEDIRALVPTAASQEASPRPERGSRKDSP